MSCYDLMKMTAEYTDDIMKLLIDGGRLSIIHRELVYGLLSLNPGLSWGAVERGTRRVIGFILLTRLPDDTFLIGLYFTHPEYRGLGIGTSVFDACVTAVRDKGTVRLSTFRMNLKHKYPAKGFVFCAYGCIGTTGSVDIKEDGKNTAIVTQPLFEKGVCIRPYMATDFDMLAKYDSKIFIIPREAVLKLHLTACELVVVAFSGGEVVGYATTQHYSGFIHIRPLYADNDTIATALVKSVLHSLKHGTPILVCCPSGIRQQFWKQFGISTVKYTNLWMTNREVDEPKLDGVYSQYNTWYMTV